METTACARGRPPSGTRVFWVGNPLVVPIVPKGGPPGLARESLACQGGLLGTSISSSLGRFPRQLYECEGRSHRKAAGVCRRVASASGARMNGSRRWNPKSSSRFGSDGTRPVRHLPAKAAARSHENPYEEQNAGYCAASCEQRRIASDAGNAESCEELENWRADLGVHARLSPRRSKIVGERPGVSNAARIWIDHPYVNIEIAGPNFSQPIVDRGRDNRVRGAR